MIGLQPRLAREALTHSTLMSIVGALHFAGAAVRDLITSLGLSKRLCVNEHTNTHTRTQCVCVCYFY